MKSAKVTQDYVAEKMELTQGTIAHWLNGRRAVNLRDFFQLCEYARADPQTILFGDTQGDAVTKLAELLAEHPALGDLVPRPTRAEIVKELPPARSTRRRKRYPNAGYRGKRRMTT